MGEDTSFSVKLSLDEYLASDYPLPVWSDVPVITTHIEYSRDDKWTNWVFFAGPKVCGSVISTMG